MSRSYRLPIFQDKPRNHKRSTAYWKRVRRATKIAVQQDKEIPNPKTIVNDYDYCDYRTDFRFYKPAFYYTKEKWREWELVHIRK